MVDSSNNFIGSKLDIDKHPSLVKEPSIFYLLNGDITDYSNAGNISFIQNTLSNELCYKLPYEYKYYGSIELDKNQHAIFISNGTLSSIVLLDTDTCTSEVIVQSDCFDFKSEIQGAYKYYNNKRRIYWVEKDKSPKFLDLCTIPYIKTSDCDECVDVFTKKVDCEAMDFNSKVNYPDVSLNESTGNLPNGVYQIAIAFTDDKKRFTNYYIYPELLKLHSNNKKLFGINIDFKSCFKTSFDQYELVLITSKSSRGTLAQRIGYFDTSQTSVSITDLDETFFTPIDPVVLQSEKKYIYSAKDIAVNSESLVLVDIKDNIQFDYREEACAVLVEWVEMTVKASEAHLYPSFMRDEVYPIEIGFKLPNGQITHFTHIPNTNFGSNTNGTVSSIFDDALNNEDHAETSANICNQTAKKYWEVYNTAEVTNVSTEDCVLCNSVERSSGKFGYWQSKDNLYPDDYPCDLECTPIRYHKMPDHKISHIHTNKSANSCTEPCVNILTIRLSNVTLPKDCNGVDINVDGYLVSVGDRTNNKSILHKGLLFNTANEDISCNEISQYANYPFNDTQEDRFLTNELRKQGSLSNINYNGLNSYNNNKFTYHSPDIEYIKGSTGTELKLYTEEIGRISGEFHNTEELPKYKVLSPLARLAAQGVGLLQAKIALNGNKCTTSVTENICSKLKERKTDIAGFPVAKVTGQPIGGGGGTVVLTPTPPVSTVTIASNSGGSIDTEIIKEGNDYTSTVEGDEPCDGTEYIINSFDTDSIGGSSFISTISNLFGNLFNNKQECKLIFDTTAEKGTKLIIQVEDRSYMGTATADGTVEIKVGPDCDSIPSSFSIGSGGATGNAYFSPKCPCTGDTQVRTQIRDNICDAKIDFIEDKEWFEKIPALIYYYTEGVRASQRLLQSVLKPKNYGVQATFVADYDSYITDSIVVGNSRRLIKNQQYLIPIKQLIGEEKFNNWSRTSADYLELDSDIAGTTEKDNSRISYSDVMCDIGGTVNTDCDDSISFGHCNVDRDGVKIQAVSYYAGIKQYKPNQYGNLNNYRSNIVSSVIPLSSSTTVYGGDVYISKHKTVRKMPFFTKLPLGLPNDIEFSFQDYPNIGTPRYWMDISKESALEDVVEQIPLLGNFFYDYNLERIEELGKCGSGLNFLTALGGIGNAFQWVTDLLTWTTSLGASGFTNPFKLSGVFYTHVTGVIQYYGESEFISNYREYNEIPNSNINLEPKDLAKAKNYNIPETFLYNLQFLSKGFNKNVISNPKTDCCKKTSTDLIYSTKLDNQSSSDNWLNFPVLNYQQFSENNGKFVGIQEIDNYNLFIAFEDAVFITQQDEGLLSQSGNTFFLGSPDAFKRRLKKLSTDAGCSDKNSIVTTKYGVFWGDSKRGKFYNYTSNISDITGEIQSWVYENLKGEIKGEFDSYSDNLFYTFNGTTISYKPKIQGFVSFHSWIPQDYLKVTNNILTTNDVGIWKHNKKGDYQSYYGNFEPFEIGYVINNKFKTGVLQSLEVYSEWYKPIAYNENIQKDGFFDKLLIYNNKYSTGINDLYIKDNNIMNNSISDIGVSLVEDCVFRINEFKVKSTQQPFLSWDKYMYSHNGEQLLESAPLRGKWFKVHLTSTKDNYKKLIQISNNKEDQVIF